MLSVNRARLLVLICALLTSATAGTSAADDEGRELVWSRTLGRGGVEYELGAIGGHEDDLLIAAAARPLGSVDVAANRVTLWLLSSAGEITTESDTLRALDAPELKALVAVTAIISTAKGYLLLAETTNGQPAVLEIGEKGSVEEVRRIDVKGTFTGFLELGDGDLLLFGHQDLDLLVVRVGSEGKVTPWVHEDLGKMDYAVDAVPWKSGTGEVLLVANSGDYDYLFTGPSKVLLRKLDSAGHLLKEVAFPGSQGRAATLGPDLALVVFDRDPSLGQEIVLQALDSDLEVRWERTLLEAESGFSTFRILQQGDALMVAGAKAEKPYLVPVSSRGEVKTDSWFSQSPSADDFHFLLTDSGVIFAGSVYQDVEGLDLVQRVFVGKGKRE